MRISLDIAINDAKLNHSLIGRCNRYRLIYDHRIFQCGFKDRGKDVGIIGIGNFIKHFCNLNL